MRLVTVLVAMLFSVGAFAGAPTAKDEDLLKKILKVECADNTDAIVKRLGLPKQSLTCTTKGSKIPDLITLNYGRFWILLRGGGAIQVVDHSAYEDACNVDTSDAISLCQPLRKTISIDSLE